MKRLDRAPLWLLFGFMFVCPAVVWFLGSSLLLTFGWCLLSMVIAVVVYSYGILKRNSTIAATVASDMDAHLFPRRMVTGLLVAVVAAWILAVEMQPYLQFGLIPVGWDTAQHLYRSRLILEGRVGDMMDLSGGSSFLTYFLLAALSLGNPEYLLTARIASVFALSLVLYSLTAYLVKTKYGSLAVGLPAVLVCAVWFSMYRLSADLHKTMLALIFLMPLLLIYSSGMSRRTRIIVSMLSFAISISQIEMSVLVIGAVFAFEALRFRSNRDHASALSGLLCVALPALPALATALTYDTRFVSVAFYYEEVLLSPDSLTVSYTLGAILAPLSLLGVAGYVADLRHPIRLTNLLPVFTLVVLLMIVVPSFILASPSLFRKMAPRALTVLPLPFMVTDGLRRLKDLFPIRNHAHAGFLPRREICTTGLIVLILLGAASVPSMAAVHHRPFIDPSTYGELVELSSQQINYPFIFITRSESGSQYRDDGWVGAFVGSHYAWYGPVVYLIAGVPYPVNNPTDAYYSARAFAVLNESDFDFPLLSDGISIITTRSLYGPLSSREASLVSEICDGGYSFDPSARLSLLYNYTHDSHEPFDYSGSWVFYDYALLVTSCVAGGEFIRYPILFAAGGTYRISVVLRDSTANLSHIDVWLDDGLLAEIHHHDTMGPKTYEWLQNSTGMGVHFLKFGFGNPGLAGELVVYSIAVIRSDI